MAEADSRLTSLLPSREEIQRLAQTPRIKAILDKLEERVLIEENLPSNNLPQGTVLPKVTYRGRS